MQRNWIGRSVGAEVTFPVQKPPQQRIKVYTTRVDTIYGATFLVLAPEHELVDELTTPEQREAVEEYIAGHQAPLGARPDGRHQNRFGRVYRQLRPATR